MNTSDCIKLLDQTVRDLPLSREQHLKLIAALKTLEARSLKLEEIERALEKKKAEQQAAEQAE